jgi:hypothetical protein
MNREPFRKKAGLQAVRKAAKVRLDACQNYEK